MDARFWSDIVRTRDIDTIVRCTGDWRRSKEFITDWNNFPEKLMLIITELSESSDSFLDSPEVDLDNLVEEWIDVSVRTIDLLEACKLDIVLSVRSLLMVRDHGSTINIQEELLKGPETFFETLERFNENTCNKCMKHLAGAMEAFRDIRFDSETSLPIITTDKDKHCISNISFSLSATLYEAISAVQELGRSWWDEYAKKMEKNERRLPRHGRER